MKTLRGRIALVTGASRGIGPHIAAALAVEGMHVALTARSERGLSETAEYIRKNGGTAEIFPADLTRLQELRGLLERIRDVFGYIEILVNNAGLESEGAFQDLSQENIESTIALNFAAPVELTRLVLPDMVSRGGGHIVHISSIGARAPSAYDALYCGTKAGLSEWNRAVQQELFGSGIGFSVLYPGYVRDTGMFERYHLKPPAITGSCSAERVAAEVIRAIRKNRREIVINSHPLKPFFMLRILCPALYDFLTRVSGVTAFQKRKVEVLSED